MSVWSKYCRPGARFCGECLLALVCWALWLVLAILLAGQIGIAVSNELAVPGFLLRSFEQRLAASQLQVRFGHAVFDPTGRILVRDVQFKLPDFEEPVATARSVYIELDPWSLVVGRFEPERLHLTGLNVSVPAMLAPSGRNEEVLHELDLIATPGAHEIAIDRLSGRIGSVPIEVRGRFTLPRATTPARKPPAVPVLLARYFPLACRQLVTVVDRLDQLEGASVRIELTPSPTRGALARIDFAAHVVRQPGAHPLTLTDVRASTRLPVLGNGPRGLQLNLDVAEAATDLGTIRPLHLRLRGLLRPTAPFLDFRTAELSAGEVRAAEFVLRSPLARLAGPWPRLRGELFATYADLPLAAKAEVDAAARRGEAQLDATLSPTLVATIGRRLGRDLHPFIDFGAPAELHARAAFAPGWKFTGASGRFAASKIDGHGVVFDSVTGEFAGDLHHVVADHLVGHVGENFARGRFEQDFATRDYRFLLEGRLRPMALSPWFHDWWPNFFRQLEFPAAPPEASVDVAGRWKEPASSHVFVYATSTDHPVLRGVSFDYARTLLFIRPNFIDGFEVFGTRGAAELRGSFQRHVDFAAGEWRAMDLDFFSTLDLDSGRRLLGPAIGDQLQPFVFARAPTVTVRGHFDGPAAPGGPKHRLSVDAESPAAFGFYGFPFDRIAFKAVLENDTITVNDIEAGVAGGTLTGTAREWATPAGHRLGFDATLRDARLAPAVSTVEKYVAQRRGDRTPPPDRFLTGKSSVRLEAALSAEGAIDDIYSFHGSGNALISGDELGEVRLLGGLSQLLNFTSLRFTSARTSFQLDGRKMTFPNVNITGANSAIDAEGTYGLESHQLDFKARVFPFRESKSFLQSVVGTVLTPLSHALEVKLTGPLDNPSWAFVIGPTNLLRSLTEPDAPKPPDKTPTATDSPPPYLTR